MKKIAFLLFVVLLIAGYFFSPIFLSAIGRYLVVDDPPSKCDAVLVLNTGLEYHPRLIEAAGLFNAGWTEFVVINGNRKTDVLRDLEDKGYEPCCPWYENSFRILELYGVPRVKIIPISAEDAYDTISEAQAVGPEIVARGFSKLIVTTSKFHTRRARHIWQKMYGDRLSVITVTAKTDPFDPDGWWKDGRQIRWVLAEYGAWVFYWWQKTIGK